MWRLADYWLICLLTASSGGEMVVGKDNVIAEHPALRFSVWGIFAHVCTFIARSVHKS
jgi:hypothetical protein